MQLFAVSQEHLSRRGLLFIGNLNTADDPRDLVPSVVAGDLSYHALAPTVYFDFFYQKMMIDRLLIKMDSGIYHDPCRYLGEVIRYDRKQQNGRTDLF